MITLQRFNTYSLCIIIIIIKKYIIWSEGGVVLEGVKRKSVARAPHGCGFENEKGVHYLPILGGLLKFCIK